MAHEVEPPGVAGADRAPARPPQAAPERRRREQRDCLSCLTLLVLGLVMVYVVGRLSFTPP